MNIRRSVFYGGMPPRATVSRLLDAQTPRSDEARQAELMVRELFKTDDGILPGDAGDLINLAIHDILHPWRT